MPRTKRTELEHNFIYARWETFGLWLRSRRQMRGITQIEIAQIVGVSRRQWIRYEQGSKMYRKRMKIVAAALNVPLETMLDRAGYKVSPMRNDVKGRLAKIGVLLFAGATKFAILELLRLNDRIAETKKNVRPRGAGLDATDFASAVWSVNGLRQDLFELLLSTMQARAEDKRNEPKMRPSDRNRLWKKCLDAIDGNIGPVMSYEDFVAIEVDSPNGMN